MKVNDSQFNVSQLQTSQGPSNDLFDLNIKMSETDLKVSNQLITSKFLCTPTCTSQGSGNSFCC